MLCLPYLVSAFASAYLFLVPELQALYSINREVAITGFVLYVIGWGPGPLLWAPLSGKPHALATSMVSISMLSPYHSYLLPDRLHRPKASLHRLFAPLDRL